MECEAFEYSHEKFETGDEAIDTINLFNADQLSSTLLMEDGGKLLQEDGSKLILEDTSPEDFSPSANNTLYYEQSGSVVDFSEKNPFISVDGNGRW